MSEPAPKQLPLLQWDILSRSSKPLDWAWVCGVVLVSGLVGGLLGAKYIGLALILYVFVFCMALRGWIRASYPAEEGALYHLGGQFDFPAVSKRQELIADLIGLFGALLIAQIILRFMPEYLAMAPTIITLTVCGGFVLLRYRALFTACFGGGKLAAASQRRLQRMLGERQGRGGGSILRLLGVTMLWLLVWAGMSFAYATGQLGGTHAFGYNLSTGSYLALLFGYPVIIFCPAVVHLIFFEQLTQILRGWEEFHNG